MRLQRRLRASAQWLWARRPSRRAVLIALGLLPPLAAIVVLASPVPDFAAEKAASSGSEAVLLARDGQVLQHLRLDRSQRALGWVPLERVSPAMREAVLLAEDEHFRYHPGVDPLAILSAAFDNLKRERPRGASTITMQLADLLCGRAARPSSGHGLFGKLDQVRRALALELHWSKDQILEAYLNRVGFRGDLVGIGAASYGLLAKGPEGLGDADSAVLAALIRAPGASRARLARRACAVLRAGGRGLACDEASLVAMAMPRRPHAMPGVDDAPHLARLLLKKPGETLRSTLDADLQRFAATALRNRLAELDERHVEDGAVIVLDNRTGEVLAWVGSSGELSGAAAVDGVQALRQPGSTLKPFLYGLAIEQGWLSAASLLDDSPLALTTPSGLYIPQDYDRHFRGAVSVRSALGSSLNVPAVRTLTLVGLDRFLQQLHRLGLATLDRDAEFYGYGLALGGAEVRLADLANAYRALANGGEFTALHLKPGETAGARRRAISPQAAFIIGDILADPAARALTFGLASPLSTRAWAAVKTGTSKGMRDNWAIGFTDRYTVGVWVGNFSGEPMWDVSGVTGAAPIWRDLVEHLHQREASRTPQPPVGVQRRSISFEPEIEAAREEWFLSPKGLSSRVGPAVVQRLAEARPQLIAPPDSAILAPDPDIPQRAQAVLLQANGAGCLWLDGHAAAPCGRLKALVPLPLPGSHRLELRAKGSGEVLDVHAFTVRALSAPHRSGT